MTGFPYGFREKIRQAMGQFRGSSIESQAVRRGGSAALDCANRAGPCRWILGNGSAPWDTAAGLVILEEAGGRVTDFAGNRFPCSEGDRRVQWQDPRGDGAGVGSG